MLLDNYLYVINSRRAIEERIVDEIKMSDIEKNYVDEEGNSHPGIEAMEAN